jgi:hypothetical protein
LPATCSTRSTPELGEVFAGSTCPCYVCEAEISEQVRTSGITLMDWRQERPDEEAVVAQLERLAERRVVPAGEAEGHARKLGYTLGGTGRPAA